MAQRDDLRAKALQDLQQFEVLMLNGHFDYGNGFHGRAYINPHALFRHPSTIWGFAQDLLDLLPSELTGVSVFHKASETWEFRPGPLFANVVLTDEVNRATPRSQSAVLEAMEERQVSVDGTSHPLPNPFVLIATQNQFAVEFNFAGMAAGAGGNSEVWGRVALGRYRFDPHSNHPKPRDDSLHPSDWRADLHGYGENQRGRPARQSGVRACRSSERQVRVQFDMPGSFGYSAGGF